MQYADYWRPGVRQWGVRAVEQELSLTFPCSPPREGCCCCCCSHVGLSSSSSRVGSLKAIPALLFTSLNPHKCVTGCRAVPAVAKTPWGWGGSTILLVPCPPDAFLGVVTYCLAPTDFMDWGATPVPLNSWLLSTPCPIYATINNGRK